MQSVAANHAGDIPLADQATRPVVVENAAQAWRQLEELNFPGFSCTVH